MNVELEPFSLRHIIPQFREFNSAARDNYARLAPYFWWAHTGVISRFKLILSGIIAEKMSHIMHDLPYNKRFIIRTDGKFAGTCGLDGVSMDAPRAEFWIFLTPESQGHSIASNALGQIEEFARTKSIGEIYARTAQKNLPPQIMLKNNHYKLLTGERVYLFDLLDTLRWSKKITR